MMLDRIIRSEEAAHESAPSDWNFACLRDVATFTSGTTPSRARQEDYFNGGTYPWAKTLDLNNSLIRRTDERVTERALKETGLKIHPSGTVLVAMYGGFQQIGRTGILTVPAAVNQAIIAVLPDSSKLTFKYLLHVLNYRVEYWRSIASSSRKDPNITSKDVKGFPIAFPCVREQDAISETLSHVDDLIATLERFIVKKKEIKQGMMQHLLTGNSRLTGFTTPWKLRSISELLRLRSDRNLYSEFLTVLTCTKHMGFVRSSDYFKNQVFSRDLTAYRVIYRGDIGYPANHIEEGSIGVQEIEDRALVSPIYVVMEPRPDVDSYFLQRLLKLDTYRQKFSQATNASVDRRGSLRWPEFSRIEVSMPEIGEQRRVSRALRDAELEISRLEQKLRVTRDVKQGMMQELLTGRTRLPVEESAT